MARIRRTPVTITLDPVVRSKMEVIAEESGHSLSRLLEVLARAEIKRYEAEHGEIPLQ